MLVLSWYSPGLADDNGEPTEDLVPAILDAAHRHNLKVRNRETERQTDALLWNQFLGFMSAE